MRVIPTRTLVTGRNEKHRHGLNIQPGEGDVGTRQLITVLEHIVAQRFDEKLIREKNGHLARDVLETWWQFGFPKALLLTTGRWFKLGPCRGEGNG